MSEGLPGLPGLRGGWGEIQPSHISINGNNCILWTFFPYALIKQLVTYGLPSGLSLNCILWSGV